MGFLNQFSFSNLAAWLGNQPKRESLRDVVFDHESYGEKLRGDSTMQMGQPAKVPEETQSAFAMAMRGLEFVHHEEFEPPQALMDQVHKGVNPELAKQIMEMVPYTNGPIPTKLSTDIAKFFRYVRDWELSGHAADLVDPLLSLKTVPAPKGGITFYIELDAANKTFAFSYALCSNHENFNYEMGRNISKGRFDNDNWYEVKNYDGSKSVVENIGVAICNFVYNQTADENKDIVFSSTPEADKISLRDLKEIYKRIN